MNDRDRRNQADWDERSERSYRQQRDTPRQPQQWYDEDAAFSGNYQSGGNPSGEYQFDSYQGGGQSGGRQSGGQYASNYRGRGGDASSYDRDRNRSGQYDQESYGRNGRSGLGDREYRGGSEWGQASADSFENRYSSFGANDFGGRDYVAGTGNAYGRGRSAFGGGNYGSSGGYGARSFDRDRSDRSGDDGGRYSHRHIGPNDYGDWRSYGESRGFLARAGDEVASWFGDDEAARRREQDHRGRGPSDYTRSDDRIREDVNDRLTHENNVDATHVRVTVKDGEVSLDGSVEDRRAKRCAEDVADRVSGVRHVQNNLRVDDSRSSMRSGASTATSQQVGAGQSATSVTGSTSDQSRPASAAGATTKTS